MLEAAVEDKIKDGSENGDKIASDVPMCSIVDGHVELGDGIDLTLCMVLDERLPSQWVLQPLNFRS